MTIVQPILRTHRDHIVLDLLVSVHPTCMAARAPRAAIAFAGPAAGIAPPSSFSLIEKLLDLSLLGYAEHPARSTLDSAVAVGIRLFLYIQEPVQRQKP